MPARPDLVTVPGLTDHKPLACPLLGISSRCTRRNNSRAAVFFRMHGRCTARPVFSNMQVSQHVDRGGNSAHILDTWPAAMLLIEKWWPMGQVPHLAPGRRVPLSQNASGHKGPSGWQNQASRTHNPPLLSRPPGISSPIALVLRSQTGFRMSVSCARCLRFSAEMCMFETLMFRTHSQFAKCSNSCFSNHSTIVRFCRLLGTVHGWRGRAAALPGVASTESLFAARQMFDLFRVGAGSGPSHRKGKHKHTANLGGKAKTLNQHKNKGCTDKQDKGKLPGAGPVLGSGWKTFWKNL